MLVLFYPSFIGRVMRYLGLFATFVFLLVILSCYRSRLRFNPVDSVISNQISSDGRFAVAVIERNCGATADFSTFFVLRQANQKPVVDHDRIFVASGRHAVKVMWVNSTSVVVTCSAKISDVVKAETAVGPVSILYCYTTGAEHQRDGIETSEQTGQRE